MFHITRKSFPDRLLTMTDLSAAADLWRQWYLLSKRHLVVGEKATVQLSARIQGFARGDAANALQGELPDGTFIDPDTLEVRGPATVTDATLDMSVWNRVLSISAGRPLVAQLYVAIVGKTPWESAGPTSVNTLLLAGLPHPDGLLVKTVQRIGSVEVEEKIFRSVPWAGETKFLTAIDQFRVTGDAGRAMALLAEPGKTLFKASHIERKTLRLARVLAEMPGEHTPRGLIKRLQVPLILGGAAGVAIIRARTSPVMMSISAGGIGLAALMAGNVFFTKGARIVRYRKTMNAGLEKAYAQPPTFANVDLSAIGLADDPAVVKYTAEIIALGAVHCYDFQITSLDTAQITTRLFHLPADRTLVTLSLMTQTRDFHFFPTKPIVSATTYYSDITVSTLASKRPYRKPINPACHKRYVPEETDPATLLAHHRDYLRRLAPPGQEPLPVNPEELFALETAEYFKSRDLYQAQGCYYTWSDALHQGFEIPRRELIG